MYNLILENIAKYQQLLGVAPEIAEEKKSEILQSFGALQESTSQLNPATEEVKEDLNSAEQRGGPNATVELSEVVCDIPTYNPEKNERELKELLEKKRDFWNLFEDQATVAQRVDAKRQEKLIGLKKEQMGSEGRSELAEEMDKKLLDKNQPKVDEFEGLNPMQKFKAMSEKNKSIAPPIPNNQTGSKGRN